jgi:DNA polymerase
MGGARQAADPREADLVGADCVQFRVTKERGRWLESDLAEYVTATIHPSAVLRQRDSESRHRELAAFVADLKLVASVLRRPKDG